MKYFLYILLTISSCIAQPFTFQDLAFLGQEKVFSPKDAGNLVIWYDANSISNWWDGATPTNGMLLTNWIDYSGNGWTAINTAASKQPYWTNNASVLGGKPWVEFDSVDDYLKAATATYATPNYVFLVGKVNTTNGITQSFMDSTNATYRETIACSTNLISFFSGGTPVYQAAGNLISNFFLFEVSYTGGASSQLITNGVLNKSATGGNTSISGITLGARYTLTEYPLNGGIAELLFYDAKPSASDIVNIRNYFINKYGAYANW